MVVAAGVLGGYTVYQAERTEPVLVASRDIPPYTTITPRDVTVRSIPVSAVQSDAVQSAGTVMGHLTTVGILPNSQIRTAMFSSATSLQALVNTATNTGNVTFPLPYKAGDMESYISPQSYVDLVTSGPNNTMIHADHVLVLKNTGYQASLSSKSPNQNPMLILTLPESVYLTMAQNIGNHNVQILMIPQNGLTPSSGSGQVLGTQTTNASSTPEQAIGTSNPNSTSPVSNNPPPATVIHGTSSVSRVKGGTKK